MSLTIPSLRLVVLILVLFLVYPKSVKAVIPPDFIFNIGAQVANFFAITFLFFTAIFGAISHFFKTQFQMIKHKKIFFGLVAIILVIISLGASYWYASYKQEIEYQKWLIESEKYQEVPLESVVPEVLKEEIKPAVSLEKEILSLSTSTKELPPPPANSWLISNQSFSKIIASEQTDYLVLDARENIEYENGNFPGSIHIRFADLKAGRWLELPSDKTIYVLCWSGIRGQEVAEFLRTKKLTAQYLERGAAGWVEFGGTWSGNVKFLEKYTEAKYQALFNTEDIVQKLTEGVVLVDAREPGKYKKWHIPGSVNIPTMYTPTAQMETVFAQVPPNSQVITVCDAYVNCFDAKITGAELEKRGHEFLGRYSKPWEYAH